MIKIRIAHIADIHQGLGYPGPSPTSRFDDINCILDWTADRVIAEQCDICLIAGDCFRASKVMLDRASQEIASIVRFLGRLSGAGIEVIVISGTPSHDAVAAYELIKEMQIPHIYIFTKPGMSYDIDVAIQKYIDNELTYPNLVFNGPYHIACLPGLNRSALMTQDEYKGLPPEQVHRIMTDKITQLCQGMSAQMPDDRPKILMAHMTYQNADKGFDDLLMQQEPILTREAVSGFDLVCLGHIHRPQQIDGKVFYSGPVERLSFNEEDVTPGFWIHEIDTDAKPMKLSDKTMDIVKEYGGDFSWKSVVSSQFIETPARRYQTFTFDEGTIKGVNQHGFHYLGSCVEDDAKDAIVRLNYTCTEETAMQINRKALEKALYDANCFYVAEIKADIERSDRARDVTVNESLTPLDALGKWCMNQGIDESETAALQAMAAELLESGVST